MNRDLIYGIWEMHHIAGFKNGESTSERAKSGMFVFTRDHRVLQYSGARGDRDDLEAKGQSVRIPEGGRI
jgi:hypothetical protein